MALPTPETMPTLLDAMSRVTDRTITEWQQEQDRFLSLILNPEPWPLTVQYGRGRITYVPRDHFYWDREPPGPSDCTWIVPGTLEKEPPWRR